MDKFIVVRISFRGESELHSVEYKDTFLDAQRRFYNIVAADLANSEITYQATYIIDSNGLMLESRVFDRRPALENESE